MAGKQVVFVRGGKTDAGFPWMYFHFDPFQDKDPGPVDVVLFDYPAGTRKTWKKWVAKHDKKPPANPDSEDPLTPKVQLRLSDGTISTGAAKPSVLAFYDWMKTQDKESVVSLQFFSHGFVEGPILWAEAFEDSDIQALEDPRDANDTEFRLRDFYGSNPLAGKEGAAFTKPLDPAALIKLWGCNEGRTDPDTGDWRDGYPWRQMITRYMKSPKGEKGDAARTANLEAYLDSLEGTYQLLLATKLGLTSWAGPLGWGSNPYEKDILPNKTTRTLRYTGKFPPDLTKELWWRMSAFFTGQFRTFYKDVLKARIDATGYVEYKRSWFDDARKSVRTALAPSPVMTPQDLFHRLNDRIGRLSPPPP
jgi:hypothetical protein